MSPDTFVIPRLFNSSYDLQPKPVCQAAATFLRTRSYIRLTIDHPKVKQERSLYTFMLRRRRLHKLFDSMHCDLRFTFMDMFASEKNLVLQDCFVSLE